jgi:hypothetical protein
LLVLPPRLTRLAAYKAVALYGQVKTTFGQVFPCVGLEDSRIHSTPHKKRYKKGDKKRPKRG